MCNLCSLLLIFQGPLGLDGKPVSDDRAVRGGPGMGGPGMGGPGMGGPGMVGTVGLDPLRTWLSTKRSYLGIKLKFKSSSPIC